MLTTSSALGRSSIYNRLRIPGGVKFLSNTDSDVVSSWYTQGYGHFHIPDDLFSALQKILIDNEHPYATGHGFGQGPNWKIRVIRQGASALGINSEIHKHGIRRQVFIVPLAENTRDVLMGRAKRPKYLTKPAQEVAEFWRGRWAVPRDERYPDWRSWNKGKTLDGLRQIYNEAVGGAASDTATSGISPDTAANNIATNGTAAKLPLR